jgi:tetratricopeptide (TPR) repeat protein
VGEQTFRVVLIAGLLCVRFAEPSVAGQDQGAPVSASTSASVNPAGTSVPAPAVVSPMVAALALYRSGKFAQAEQAYNEILKADGTSWSAYVGLMRVQLKEKRLADAVASLAKAVEIAPQSEEVKVAQAELYFRQGRIQDAELSLTPLVKNHTKQARAYYALGMIYWAGSNYQHAKVLLDAAHQSDPDDPDIRRRWLMTLTRKELTKELKGYLAGESDDDADQREHLQTELITLEESEENARLGCRIAGNTSELHVPMQRLMYGAQRIRGYGLRADINGAKGNLLLDTGASGVLISKKLADRAGIKSIVSSDVHGIGDKGTVSGYVGVADSIKFGDLEFQGCQVRVVERNSVADEDGLIGADVFGHYLVTIDFPDKKFDLTPLPAVPPPSDAEKALAKKYPNSARFRDRYIADAMKEYSFVYRFGHMLLIPTKINESKPKLFLIDTGAFSDTISPEAAKEFTRVHSDDRMKVKGLNGAVNNVFSADDLTLTFSHFRQPARDMVAFDTSKISEGVGTEVSGMLGFAMLYQMKLKIDYRDGLVDFQYDPNRFH